MYDKDGAAAAGDLVHFEDARGGVRFTTADANGRFTMEALAPGAWRITAVDMNAVASGGSAGDKSAIIGSARLARIELADGESGHVVLGALRAAAVRVHGSVMQGGAPRGGCWIVFFPASGGGAERMQLASVGKDGGYEVMLASPGMYTVSVPQIPGDDDSTVDFTRAVPAAGEHRLDLALPDGRIAGRVLRADGRPAAGARVTVASEGSRTGDEYHQGQYTEVLADGSGRFVVPALRGGSYELAVGGPSDGGDCFARTVVGEVLLAEGAARDDVEVRLAEPGAIAVRARHADGSPYENAAIFVRNEHGTIVDALSSSTTGENGRGEHACLAPGTYTVLARDGAHASRESAPVRVRAGEEAQVELVLVQGTKLRLELEGADGVRVPGWVHVFDDEDREVGGLFPASEVEARYFAGDFSPSAPVVGPLPPGRYRIAASALRGLAGEVQVTLSGEPERAVTVVLAP